MVNIIKQSKTMHFRVLTRKVKRVLPRRFTRRDQTEKRRRSDQTSPSVQNQKLGRRMAEIHATSYMTMPCQCPQSHLKRMPFWGKSGTALICEDTRSNRGSMVWRCFPMTFQNANEAWTLCCGGPSPMIQEPCGLVVAFGWGALVHTFSNDPESNVGLMLD